MKKSAKEIENDLRPNKCKGCIHCGKSRRYDCTYYFKYHIYCSLVTRGENIYYFHGCEYFTPVGPITKSKDNIIYTCTDKPWTVAGMSYDLGPGAFKAIDEMVELIKKHRFSNRHTRPLKGFSPLYDFRKSHFFPQLLRAVLDKPESWRKQLAAIGYLKTRVKK